MSLAFIPALMLHPAIGVSGTTVVLFAVSAYTGFQMGWVMLAPRPHLARFFGMLYLYLFLGLAPLAQGYSGHYPLATYIPPADARTAALIAAVFLAAIEGAYWTDRRRRATRAQTRRPTRTLAPRRVIWLAVLAVPAAVYEIRRLGGVGVLFSSRQEFHTAIVGSTAETDAATLALHGSLLAAPLFVAAALLTIAVREKMSRHAWVAALLIVAAVIVRNPISSSRYSFGTGVIALAIAIGWPLRVRLYRVLAVVSLLGITVFFTIFNVFRYATHSTHGSISTPAQTLTQGDYDSFQQMTNTIGYVNTHGFAFGHQLLSEVLFFVPRSIWSGKGIDSGALVAKATGYSFVNLSCPLPTEGYIDFGWVGVIGFGLGLGVLWSRVDEAMTRHDRRLTFVGVFAPIIAVYQVIILRGSLLQALGLISLIAVLVLLCTERSRQNAEPGQAGSAVTR